MTAPHTHKTSAIKGARAAQLGVLVIAACSVGLFAWGIPGMRPVDSSVPTAPEVPPPQKPKSDSVAPPDDAVVSDIVFGFESIANLPTVVSVAGDLAGDPVEDTPVIEAPPPVDTVSFVGAVITPKRRIAVLRINETQVWIDEGETKNDIEVLEVERDGVRIRGLSGEEETLEPAPRKKGQLTQLARAPSTRTPPAAGGTRGNPWQGGPPGAVQQQAAETAAAIEAGGGVPNAEGESNWDQERADRVRRAMERNQDRAVERFRRGGDGGGR